jgi:hypothetical protein
VSIFAASANENRARSAKRLCVSCTISASIASDRTVRAPTPGVSNDSAKSCGPGCAAAEARRRGRCPAEHPYKSGPSG